MTVTLSKTALVALDRFRHQRNIRTRAKALETALLEVSEEGVLPPEELVLSPKEKVLLEKRMAEAKAGKVVPVSVILEDLAKRSQNPA
jgi:hypothetical protein